MKNENSTFSISSTTYTSVDDRLEAKLKVDQKNLGKALRALEKAGVEFELVSVEKTDSPSYTSYPVPVYPVTYPLNPLPTYPPTYPWYVRGDESTGSGHLIYQPYTVSVETGVETY